MSGKDLKWAILGILAHRRQVGPSFLSPYPTYVMQKITAAKSSLQKYGGWEMDSYFSGVRRYLWHEVNVEKLKWGQMTTRQHCTHKKYEETAQRTAVLPMSLLSHKQHVSPVYTV
jgi:hypothetical protein